MSAAGVQSPDAITAGTQFSGVALSGVQVSPFAAISVQTSAVGASGSHFSRALAAIIADIDANAIPFNRRCGVGVIVRLADVAALAFLMIAVAAVMDSAHAAVASTCRSRITSAETVAAHAAVAGTSRTRSTLAAAVAAAAVDASALIKRAAEAAVVSVALVCAATILASPSA